MGSGLKNIITALLLLLVSGCVTYEGVVLKNKTNSSWTRKVTHGCGGAQTHSIKPGEDVFVGQRRGMSMNAITEVLLIEGDDR